MKIVIDANVFLNVIFEEEGFLESSKRLLKLVEQNRFRGYISSVTLSEITWVVHRESGYRKAREALSYLKDLSELGLIKVIPLDEEIVSGMLECVEKYNLSLVDSLVLSTVMNIGADALVTRDESFRRVREVEVKIPEELV
ncbi:MAG: PIN domain-containing protein [Candidatus Bathyarchaeia archaeon]|nr:PIN domain-containing protein [Candidatus Bathyarchaeota archaeon]